MIFTSRMVQLFAVVLRKDRQRVTEALLREGVIQLISASELSAESQRRISTPAEQSPGSLTELSDLRKRIEGLLHTVGIIPTPPRQADLNERTAVDIEKEKGWLNRIDSERAAVREKQRAIQQEILKLEDLRRQVGLYGAGLSDVAARAPHSFVSLQTGRIPASHAARFAEGLKNLPSVSIPVGG